MRSQRFFQMITACVAGASLLLVVRAEGQPETDPGLTPILPEVDVADLAGTACPGNDASDIMVKVGPICVDVYEASLWNSLSGGRQIDATACNDDGNDCTNIFARSVRGVEPAADITWFQAQQACANAEKRLLTNAEWQMAAAGAPDTGGADDGVTTCNTDDLEPGVAPAGSRSACFSNHGVYDMVGNLNEWVGDWVPRSTGCFSSMFESQDFNCTAGASESDGPGALIRGGSFRSSSSAGVFAIDGIRTPAYKRDSSGFRCAR